MNATRRLLLPILLLLPFASNASAQTADDSAPAVSQTLYPQIVRLSYVEGDVRLARGKKAAKQTGDDWDKAAIDVPLEAGFTLVTGTGRAEIEFEDSSTAYIADNSVLAFTKLSSKAGLTDTEMNLLAGSMTLHLSGGAAGAGSAADRYLVTTPANHILHDTASTVCFRIDSFLDGTAVTPQDNETLYVANSATGEVKAMGMRVRTYSTQGHTAFFAPPGMPLPKRNDAAYRAAHAEWDSWVANRIATREAALAAVMKLAGLTNPVPGLAELKDQGSFFDCAPYGTCWEPTNGWAPAGEEDSMPATSSRNTGYFAAPAHLMPASYQISGQGPQTLGQQPNQPGAKPRLVTEDDYFPCSPFGIHSVYQRDPITGKLKLLYSSSIRNFNPYPYHWAVCHSGTWMHHHRRLVWVPGHKPHHHPPIHWVKAAGGKVGYVPMHPKDVAGKPPVNHKSGVYAVTDGKHGVVEHLEETRFTSGKPVDLLTEAPRGFRHEPVAPLLRIEAPRVETLLMAQAIAHPGQPITEKHSSFELTFNQKSQGFNLASRQELPGGKSNVVSMPFTNHGGAMVSGAGSARASFSGGGTSSGFSGGATHSASFSGGGSSSAASSASHASSGGGGSVSSSGGGASSSGGASHH